MSNEFKVSGNFAVLMGSKSVTPSIRRSFAGVMRPAYLRGSNEFKNCHAQHLKAEFRMSNEPSLFSRA